MCISVIARQLIPLTFLLLSACTTGIAEFETYDTAYRSQAAEADRVLDRLAAAERSVVRRQFAVDQEKSGRIRAFDPDEALYYLAISDPPLTGTIRGSVAAVTRYNAALVGLADGSAAEALTARVGAGTSALTQAAGAVTAVTGVGAVAAPALQAAISVALPIFQRLANIVDRAEFRRQLVLAYPDIRALLLELRAGSPAMFEVIKRSYVERGGLGGGRVEGIPTGDLPRVESDRTLLAGWVVLIDRTILAMDQAVAAVSGDGAPGDVAGLVEAATEIRSLADIIRAAQTVGQP
jgi:hypothetical protein